MSNYRISKKAIEDLENIWLYTFNNWSKEQADRYHNLIISEISFISNNYNLSRDMSDVCSGYRVTKVKSHLIFFKRGNDEVVEIIRILHQSMDIDKRLKE